MPIEVIKAKKYLLKGRDILFITNTFKVPKVSYRVIGHQEKRLRYVLKVNHLYYIGLFND